jgi:hypothetical protein
MPKMTRKEFFRSAQTARYLWAKQVDPEAVKLFEKKANDDRRRTSENHK